MIRNEICEAAKTQEDDNASAPAITIASKLPTHCNLSQEAIGGGGQSGGMMDAGQQVRQQVAKYRASAAHNLNRTAGVLGILVLAYALAISWYSWQDEKARQISYLTTVAELEAKAINNYFMHLETDLQSLGEDMIRADDRIDLDQAHELAKKFRLLHSELLNVTLLQADGSVLLTAKAPHQSARGILAKEASFIKFLEAVKQGTALAIGQPLIEGMGKEVIVPVRYAVKDRQGNLTYILSANLPQEYLRSFWEDAPITHTAALGLLSDKGYMLSRYPVPANFSLEQIYGQQRTGPLFTFLQQQNFPDRGHVEGSSMLGGPNTLFAFRRLEQNPVSLFVLIPMSEIWLAWWDRVAGIYLSLLFMTAGAFAAYRYALRRQHASNLTENRLEDARYEIERRYRAVVEDQTELIARFLADGTLIFVNEVFARFFGQTANQLVGRKWHPEAHPGDIPLVEAKLKTLSPDNPVVEIENRVYSGDGELRWMQFVNRAFFDANAQLVEIQTVGRDITARKEFENAFNRANEKTGALLRNASDGIHILDLSGYLIEASNSFCTMLGYSREEMLGMHVSQWDAEFIGEDLNRLVARNFSNGRREQFETRNRQKNGSTFDAEVSTFALEWEGRPVLFCSTRDITERKSNEKRMAELLNEKQAILDSRLFGIVRVKNRRIAWANAAFATMFGYSEDELIGQPTRIVYPSDQAHAAFAERALPVIKSGGVYRTEIEQVRKDGSLGWYEISCGLLHPGAEEQIGVLLDSTETKRLRDELEQHKFQLERQVEERTADLSVAKEAAEAASRAKTAFLANMSHELRTPLNGIMGMTAVALRSTSDARLKDYLGKVLHSSERLHGLINNILDIVWIESERFDLKPTDFELHGLLAKLTQQQGSMARKKGLVFAIDLAPGLEKRPLKGDALRLGQLLAHLTNNAVKYTDSGTVIIRITVAEETPADLLVRFEVRDTGIGISEEHQKRLFIAFEQADTSMTRKHSGTGLGLTLSKRLAQAMSGSIGVESRPGEGSVFWFTVRLAKIARLADTESLKDPRTAEEALVASYSGARILLAEDEPFNQEVTKILMEEAGLRVDVADDGAEAVAMARETDYDLILMDLSMPILNGIDAVRQIRSLPGRSKTPILALTASVFTKHSDECFAAGMNDFIGKPVSPESLFATLLKWLESARPA